MIHSGAMREPPPPSSDGDVGSMDARLYLAGLDDELQQVLSPAAFAAAHARAQGTPFRAGVAVLLEELRNTTTKGETNERLAWQ